MQEGYEANPRWCDKVVEYVFHGGMLAKVEDVPYYLRR
jgi:hypothetical protein